MNDVVDQLAELVGRALANRWLQKQQSNHPLGRTKRPVTKCRSGSGKTTPGAPKGQSVDQ
jgi:hypothetical protein